MWSSIVSPLDYLLDRITMYRLVLYELIALLVIAMGASIVGLISYASITILGTALFLVAVCYITNTIFAKVFETPTNSESWLITALILACILTPSLSFQSLPLLFWAGVLSMASKYIFAINKKHLFNPVAIAIVLCTFGFGGTASWWMGNTIMAIPMLISGILITRKIQREDLVITTLIASVVSTLFFTLQKENPNIINSFETLFLHTSLLFFTFIMVTEPLTTPPTRNLRIMYGILIGLLFSPQIHIGSIYSTPELALVVSNIFSYLVSPKYKLVLKLKEKLQIGSTMYDFLFPLEKKLAFTPGQYMEWTLPHNADSRGNRRYFTIASSPTEDTLRLGVKFVEKGSSFKRAMLTMKEGNIIGGGQLSGEFTLPTDANQKSVFIAGGIGITPYRSMIKYLLDTNQRRDIIIMYSNAHESEIVYNDVFDAASVIGIKTIYTLTDKDALPQNWTGEVGRINSEMIQKYIPDYKERMFYLSGSQPMVDGTEETLRNMGITTIKKDFFPGFV